MKKLFTVITVCYNSSETIRDTLDSVLSQEFKDYEYVIVDGGSKDGTVDLLKEYEPKFEGRMRFISEPDKGIYDAMNKGIAMAQGEYLAFINSDDALEPDVLGKTAKEIEKTHGNIYFGMVRATYPDGSEKQVVRVHPNAITTFGYSIYHQGVFEKKELFEKYGKFETKYKIYADLAHMLKLKLSGVEFTPLDLIVAKYGTGGASSVSPDNAERYAVYVAAGLMKQEDVDEILRRAKNQQRILDFAHKILCVLKFLRLK